MTILLLKLCMTPVLIASASLAARRWGPLIGGWIVALPLTSGPVLFFVAADHGVPFAVSAAVGSLAGLGAIVAFCIAYGYAGGSAGPAVGLIAASLTFAVIGAAFQPILDGSVWVVVAIVLVGTVVALRVLPAGARLSTAVAHPWWDLPARMVVATALVFGLTAIAPILGPHVSGLVATFPVYLSVMTVFAHLHAGMPAAVGVMRGLLMGMLGTVSFFLVVRFGLEPAGVGPTFLAATLTALAFQALALAVLRRPGDGSQAPLAEVPLPEI